MNGGEIARKGFIYQDWAAAHQFLTDEDVDQLNIEVHDDFSIFRFDEDPTFRQFFQAKSSNSGSLSWTTFRTSIVPNFYEICDEFHSEEEVLSFEIVANYKPSDQLHTFISDLEKVRDERISVEAFRGRHDRLVDALESTIGSQLDIDDVDDNVFNQLLGGLRFRFFAIDTLVSEVESFIEGCQGGRKDYTRDTLLARIRNTDSGTISKRDIERDIGYRLEQVDQSTTNYTRSPTEIRSDAKTVFQDYNQEEVEVSKPQKDESKVEAYFDLVGNQTTSEGEEVELEVSESNIREGLERAEQAKRKYESAIQDITRGFEDLFKIDDEIKQEND